MILPRETASAKRREYVATTSDLDNVERGKGRQVQDILAVKIGETFALSRFDIKQPVPRLVNDPRVFIPRDTVIIG